MYKVLQYEETTRTWSEIGKMKKARTFHAVVEVDVSLFCPGIVGLINKKQLPSSPLFTILSSLIPYLALHLLVIIAFITIDY